MRDLIPVGFLPEPSQWSHHWNPPVNWIGNQGFIGAFPIASYNINSHLIGLWVPSLAGWSQIAPFFTATAVRATASYSLAASAGNIKAGIDDQRTWLTIQFQFNKAQCSEISTSTCLYHRSISLCLSTYYIHITVHITIYLIIYT